MAAGARRRLPWLLELDDASSCAAAATLSWRRAWLLELDDASHGCWSSTTRAAARRRRPSAGDGHGCWSSTTPPMAAGARRREQLRGGGDPQLATGMAAGARRRLPWLLELDDASSCAAAAALSWRRARRRLSCACKGHGGGCLALARGTEAAALSWCVRGAHYWAWEDKEVHEASMAAAQNQEVRHLYCDKLEAVEIKYWYDDDPRLPNFLEGIQRALGKPVVVTKTDNLDGNHGI
ncbi:hypothetical protein EJB05_37861, partial [Eragrostis curvula]